MKTQSTKTPIIYRNLTLDLARTLAIVLMVIFHFIYDLKLFGYVDWDTPDGEGFKQFRWLIISLFFLCLGVSLHFAHEHGFRAQKFVTRLLQISAGALVISLGSYYFIPQNWIFFGVLHFLAFASILCIAFIKMPRISLLIALIFFALGASGMFSSRWPFHLLFDDLPAYTNDYVAPIPWFGMVFLGIVLSHQKWFRQDPLAFLAQYPVTQYAVWPGQHSLSIYLLHQPILVASLYLISLF